MNLESLTCYRSTEVILECNLIDVAKRETLQIEVKSLTSHKEHKLNADYEELPVVLIVNLETKMLCNIRKRKEQNKTYVTYT